VGREVGTKTYKLIRPTCIDYNWSVKSIVEMNWYVKNSSRAMDLANLTEAPAGYVPPSSKTVPESKGKARAAGSESSEEDSDIDIKLDDELNSLNDEESV
jgi:hypothetical protein